MDGRSSSVSAQLISTLRDWPADGLALSFFAIARLIHSSFLPLPFFFRPLISDLNKFSDTGVVPTGTPAVNIPPFLMYADEDDWLPQRVGFSAEGWYQPLSWNHAHTLFSNGPTAPSYQVGK